MAAFTFPIIPLQITHQHSCTSEQPGAHNRSHKHFRRIRSTSQQRHTAAAATGRLAARVSLCVSVCVCVCVFVCVVVWWVCVCVCVWRGVGYSMSNVYFS